MFKNIYSSDIILEKLHFIDADFMLKLLDDPAWISGIGDRNIRTIEEAEVYIKNGSMKQFETHGVGSFKVSILTDSRDNPFSFEVNGNCFQSVGICGLLKRDGLDHFDLGFAFFQEFCGKRLGFKASQHVLEYVRHSMTQVSTILAVISPHNTASLKLVQKLGFIQSEKYKYGNCEVFSLEIVR